MCTVPAKLVASLAGVFRGARISSLPKNTSSPKNACVGGYQTGGQTAVSVMLLLLSDVLLKIITYSLLKKKEGIWV